MRAGIKTGARHRITNVPERTSLRCLAGALALLAAACEGAVQERSDANAEAEVSDSGGSSNGNGNGSGAPRDAGSGGTRDDGGSDPPPESSQDGATSPPDDADTTPASEDTGPPVPPLMGGPGCGLPSAAFCEKFDAPAAAANQGRAGELDRRYWSAGRVAPQFTTGNGVAIGIGPGTVPTCRAGLPSTVLPSRDALICDANAQVADKHLVVVAAAQNYGQNSYRIRQPFDFSNRTGTIVFDASGFVQSQLIGWISLDVTEDPINAPSFAVGNNGTNNDEGSQLPRNGFEIQFQSACTTSNQTPGFGIRFVDVFTDYKSMTYASEPPVCISAARDKLNHFEVRVSKQKIEVYASPVSNDGKTFGALQLMQTVNVTLPFTRGYVHISTHNHASLKYSDEKLDAWTARWNNVGFDGPVFQNWREYEVPDALVPGMGAWNRGGPIVSVGYRVADVAAGPKEKLKLSGVDLTDAVSAKLSVSSYYPYWNSNVASFLLKYRFNGKAWHDRPLTSGELGQLMDSHTQGQIVQMIDVPMADLVQGDNTLEFVTSQVDQGYPAAVANIDLVLTTK